MVKAQTGRGARLSPVLTFGRFRLDKAAGQLLDDGGPIALTPKALALLAHLAARPGVLVKKEERARSRTKPAREDRAAARS